MTKALTLYQPWDRRVYAEDAARAEHADHLALAHPRKLTE